jgi:diguanylate cyclase (GGDEF)-like protein
MYSGAAFADFDVPREPSRRPISEAIQGLMGIAEDIPAKSDLNGSLTRSADAVVVIAELDGERCPLVQLPKASDSCGQPPLAGFLPEIENAAAKCTERRLNVGEFRRVLLAENDRALRLVLQQMLQGWGFEVLPATHGLEALNILEQERPPELAILSETLPGIDGVELCRRIADRASDCAPYVFILARSFRRLDMVRALESGAAEYLTMPFEASELRARLTVAARILTRQETLVRARDQLRIHATKDSLTGVWNRRAILEILEEELSRGARHERSTGVLLVDLDHFKRVNDLHGHLVGDLVLRETGRRLSRTLRSHDSIGRYGGEEFLVVVPGSKLSDLFELAERIRITMENEPIDAGQAKIPIMLSVGATIAAARERSTSKVIAVADDALYKAKRNGRNRTVYGA